jgi:hypothetical protein
MQERASFFPHCRRLVLGYSVQYLYIIFYTPTLLEYLNYIDIHTLLMNMIKILLSIGYEYKHTVGHDLA